MEAVNKISVPEIGVEVEFNAFEFGQWFKQYPMLLSGDEADIVANYGGYLSGVSQEAFYDVKDLLQEYGKDIVAMEGDYLKSGEINGAQYAVPIYAGYSWTMGIIYRKDVVEELGLTDKDIQTQTDAFQVLTKNDAAFSTIGQGDFNTSFYQTTTCNQQIYA